jgi:hypothetical protein
MKYCAALGVFLFLRVGIAAQSAPPYCLSREKLVYGFQTVNPKIMAICLARMDLNYLQFTNLEIATRSSMNIFPKMIHKRAASGWRISRRIQKWNSNPDVEPFSVPSFGCETMQ